MVTKKQKKILGLRSHFPATVIALILLGVLFLNRNNLGLVQEIAPNYYLSRGDYSVYFPSEPTLSVANQQLVEDGDSLVDYIYSLSLPDSKALLTATYVHSPFSGSSLTPEENLQDELNHTGNTSDFVVVSSKSTSFRGFPSIEYLAFSSSTQTYMSGRDILSNNLYMLNYIYPSGKEDKQLEQKFFNSLKFGQVSNTEPIRSNIFYTQMQTSVRECLSVSCGYIGTYPVNTSFVEPYATIADMPDWVKISWENKGVEKYGYIKSSSLGEKQLPSEEIKSQTGTSEDQTQQQAGSPKNLPNIIEKWSPHVALIVCSFNDGSADFGSGFLTNFSDGSIVVITNKHVITDETTGYAASRCALEIPGDSQTYVEDGSTFKTGNYGDWGFIPITDGNTYFNTVAMSNLPICQEQASTGDNVVVLGYPDYAGQFNNPTATEGIISGYASPYYTTSAQIESGNSGGVAINPDKDCYVGIPSAVKLGNYSNLGRILNANIVFQLPY